jgi:hypothetical protein
VVRTVGFVESELYISISATLFIFSKHQASAFIPASAVQQIVAIRCRVSTRMLNSEMNGANAHLATATEFPGCCDQNRKL